MIIKEMFNNRELELLKNIGITIEDKDYTYSQLYKISDLIIDEEVYLINSEKKGEYNSIADEYSRIAEKFIKLGDELYEKIIK
jgi:hypothetical protein